jgi:secreted trypsin-like serine protease
MKRSFSVGALAVAWVLGCGSSNPAGEVTGVIASPIQGGTDDTTHDFVVGVVQVDQGNQADANIEFCSGALLAPNLVATARHCVATLASPQITCGSSTFGDLVPIDEMFVSNESQIAMTFVKVAPGGILVPSGTDQTGVCGDDIALLILASDFILGPNGTTIQSTPGSAQVDMSNYVVPAINPPMTSSGYSTTVTAIGYGIDTPTDDAGVTAGVRRIKENIALACIPNDTTTPDLNCFAGPNASVAEQVLSANEFVSGDESTCEGDSGSGAFDQGYFNKGQWVSFGVLSRGSVSPDGTDCVQPIYTRFDAWSDLLVSAAKQAQAASKSQYPLPLWASGSSVEEIFPSSTTSSGGSSTAGLKCLGTATAGEGTACACANDCISNECVTADGTNYVCANPCNAGACAIGFTCLGSGTDSYCFAGTAPAPTSKSGGCAAAPLGPGGPDRWGSSTSFAGLGLAFLLGARRRRPKGARRT